MKILSMLPGLDDKALETVLENAQRVAGHGTPLQQEQAAEVLELVAAEQERRKVTPFKPAVPVKLPATKTARRKVARKAAAA